MDLKRKCSYIISLVFLMGCLSVTLSAAEYRTIKVGLESIYNNSSSVQLSSDGLLSFGYFSEAGFSQLGTLPTNNITIQKTGEQFIDIGGLYASYDEAYVAAQNLGGIPVYIDEGLFGVYAMNINTGSIVAPSKDRYIVKDTLSGNIIFIFNKGTRNIEFRGYDSSSSMYLTKVGGTKKYRGAIGMAGTTGITPYNVLEMEQYLYGVVPGEMPASWPQEALKAQAVAARSIAIYQYNRHVAKGYNVVDTTITQVYGGYSKEDKRTNAAVDATKGQTIKYNGKTAEAVYFSTSGGTTESAVNVWGSEIPYLVGVSDSYETEPEQGNWTRQITLADLNNCLTKQGVNIGNAQGVQITARTASGRVQEMKILGTNGTYSLTLEKIRTFFSGTKEGSLKSRLFNFNGSGSSGGNTQTPSVPTGGQVSVLSAYGTANVDVSQLTMTNGTSMQKGTNKLSVLSAYGSTTIAGSGNIQTGGSSNGNVETVWGDFTIYGAGFGHGVGMSQSGAKGMAKAGFDYVSILQHYYKGVTVE